MFYEDDCLNCVKYREAAEKARDELAMFVKKHNREADEFLKGSTVFYDDILEFKSHLDSFVEKRGLSNWNSAFVQRMLKMGESKFDYILGKGRDEAEKACDDAIKKTKDTVKEIKESMFKN